MLSNTLRMMPLLVLGTLALPLAKAYGKGIKAPAWFGKPTCKTCYYGQSPGLESEAESLSSAVQNAYEELAESKFGSGVSIQENQVTRNDGTSYEAASSRNMDLRSVPSSRLKKAAVYDKESSKWHAWVLLEFKPADIKKEQQRRDKVADKLFSESLDLLTVTRQVGNATELSGQLLLKGIPRDGRVTLDGELVATADSFLKSVGIGQYRIRLESPKHSPLEATAEVEPGKRTVVQFEPAPLESKITVKTEPSRAPVFLDGKRIGTSPVTVTTDAGRHELKVQKTSHGCRAISLDLPPNEAVTYTIRLDAGMGGSCGAIAH